MQTNGMAYPINYNTWNAKLGYNATNTAPVAQLDRVGGFEPLGRGFESLRVHHFKALKSLQPLLALVSYETDEEQYINFLDLRSP